MTSSAPLEHPEQTTPTAVKAGVTTPPLSPAPPHVEGTPLPDYEKIAVNTAKYLEHSGKAIAAFLKPFENGPSGKSEMSETLMSAAVSVGKVAEHWMSNPTRMAEAQSAIAVPFMQLWEQTLRRLKGEDVPPVVPLGRDKRYAAPEWSDMPLYSFMRQAHAIGMAWADRLVEGSDNVDARTKLKAKFFLRQVSMALSPVNFLVTNPELMRHTIESNGENLVRGAELLAEDIAAGHGSIRIRQTDSSAFELGVNVAMTPGKVVFRNELLELIQYEPTTPDVLKRPLVIVPPWINKFYILDLNRDKSFVGWAVSQGVTVFMISWVNPDERHREKSFEAYMREGLFEAVDAAKAATGEEQVNAIGYCIGGTLLATSLAYMAATDDQRIASATFFTAQADFSDAGELHVFIDEEQVQALEAEMADKGYLDGSKLAMTFNMMRPNDLLWNYVVDNYMKGKTPAPFDLLYWNSDATRLPACNHSFYLRNFYMENKLAKGELEFGGQPLDVGRVTIPTYFLAAKEDHIAPAASVFRGALLFGGPVRYVLAGSGHTAGVINPPAKQKYSYWTGGRPFGTLERWTERAAETKGSWWPDWFTWLESQAPDKVPARTPGQGALTAICDAPGTYVREKHEGAASA